MAGAAASVVAPAVETAERARDVTERTVGLLNLTDWLLPVLPWAGAAIFLIVILLAWRAKAARVEDYRNGKTRFLLSILGAAWSRLSGWAVMAAGIVAALTIAWRQGRAAGKAAWEAKRQAVRDRAIRTSGEIRHDIQNSSDPALDRRLDRWMRD